MFLSNVSVHLVRQIIDQLLFIDQLIINVCVCVFVFIFIFVFVLSCVCVGVCVWEGSFIYTFFYQIISIKRKFNGFQHYPTRNSNVWRRKEKNAKSCHSLNGIDRCIFPSFSAPLNYRFITPYLMFFMLSF